MSCANDASFNFGDAISAGLGLGMGLVLVPYMLQKPHFNKVPKIVIVCLNCQSKNPRISNSVATADKPYIRQNKSDA